MFLENAPQSPGCKNYPKYISVFILNRFLLEVSDFLNQYKPKFFHVPSVCDLKMAARKLTVEVRNQVEIDPNVPYSDESEAISDIESEYNGGLISDESEGNEDREPLSEDEFSNETGKCCLQ